MTFLDAFKDETGHTTQEIADRAHTNRTSVHLCLTGQRECLAVRRAIELAYDLPQFSLDEWIEAHGED